MHEPASRQQPEEPWQILVLDKNPDDPLWLLATVMPEDVWQARLDAAGRCQNWPAVMACIEDTILTTAELVPLRDALAWRVSGLPHPAGSTAVLALVPVPGLPAAVRLITAVRGDGQSAAAGVLVGADHDKQVIGDANGLAVRLGISPVGHWRLTGPYGAPEFYAAETAAAMSWPAFLVALGIDIEDEDAIEAILSAE